MLKSIKFKHIILLIVSVLVIIFGYNNYFLYDTTIVKVTSISSKYVDEVINQNITGKIMNGDKKGEEASFNNTTSISGVFDEQLHEKSEVFVKMSNNEVTEITGVKRDKYEIILLVLFVDLLILVGEKKGVKSLFSLIINICLSVLCIYLYINKIIGIDLLPLFIILSAIFISLSLLICHGFNKKTMVAIISSIVSVIISFLISYIVLECSKEQIYFWTMNDIEIVSDYEGLFYINILLSGLGAIMDIAITISSSLQEIILKSNNISVKELIKSGRAISKDILGTMINVMLYTCYVSIIPMVVLASRNYMPLSNAVTTYGQLELIRVLTSSISIVISIPIALYISIFIYKRGDNK